MSAHTASFANTEGTAKIFSLSKSFFFAPSFLSKKVCQPILLSLGHMDIPKGDKLVLRGLKFHGYHGVKQEERKLGQKFLVDVDAWMDLRPAGVSDCLSDTLSYTDIYRIVKEVMEGPPKNLLETVAQLIASTTLTKYPQVSAVRVQVGKPHVAVQGPVDYLGVEIIRYRNLDVQK